VADNTQLQHDERSRAQKAGSVDENHWQAGLDGELAVARAGLLLRVPRPATHGQVRFLIFRQRAPCHGAPIMINSGTQMSVAAAQSAAEAMATRIATWA